MRVLFIAENLDRPEQHLIAGLQGRGYDVRVLLSDRVTVPAPLSGAGVATTPVSLRSRLDRRGRQTIRETLDACPAGVVHCLRSNRPLANAIPALRNRPARLVCYRGTMGNLHRLDPGSRLTYLHPRIDCIACVSDAVRRYLLTLRLPRERLVTVYKGHQPAWYETAPVNRAEFHIPPDAFLVGCAANMRPLKGVDVLIRSASMLATSRPVHYLLVGEVRDPAIPRLLRKEPYRSRVHLAGFRDDAPALSGACDLFAMPTRRREGLPRAVIEAMCQRIPAVVTNVGGMPELVEDGVSGRVVPPNDPAALAAVISDLAGDPARVADMGRAARERIETHFSIEHYIDQTAALYQSLLDGTA